MKSPFPGMDPYIEACGLWEGFHDRLIHKSAKLIGSGYFLGVTSRSKHYRTLITLFLWKRRARVSVRRNQTSTITRPADNKKKKPPKRNGGGVALAEPLAELDSVEMQAFIAEEFTETFIEIYAQREERILVTSIEVLSPSNKRPDTEGWEQYERKRQAQCCSAGAGPPSEIDLKSGQKMPMLTPWPDCPYTLLVSRRRNAPRCRVWKAHYKHRLPVIPVPLLHPDPDLTLDLQPLIDGIYAAGRCD